MGNNINSKDDLVNSEDKEDSILESLISERLVELLAPRELEKGPHFDCVGGKESFFLYPKTASAYHWVSENLGINIFEIVAAGNYVLPVAKEDVVEMLTIILEDGLCFSLTLH